MKFKQQIPLLPRNFASYLSAELAAKMHKFVNTRTLRPRGKPQRRNCPFCNLLRILFHASRHEPSFHGFDHDLQAVARQFNSLSRPTTLPG